MSGETESPMEPAGCNERQDDIAAYALGALGGDEALELEAHLAGCVSCSERLHWLEPAVDLVPASVEQLEPPPELKARLMAEVEADIEPAGASRSELGVPARGGLLGRLRLGPMRPALAGLAVLALLFAGAAGYVIGTGDDGLQSYAAFPESPDLAASGTLEVGDGQATLRVSDMPAIGSDEVYQAWIARDGEVTPSSIFGVGRDGNGSAAIPDVPDDTDSVLVTVEPEGGSETPKTAPLLRADID